MCRRGSVEKVAQSGWCIPRASPAHSHSRLRSPFSTEILTVAPFFPIFITVRGNRPGKPVQLQEYEIKYLCTKAREIFINQPILLELEAPIKICGSLSLLCTRRSCDDSFGLDARQVTSMVNTMTFCDSSSMGVSHQKQTTSSSATTSTGASNPSKPYAFSSHTRSSTLKTFSSFVEITSVQASTVFMGFMTNVCCPSRHTDTLSGIESGA